jgi:hypothetical protein
MELIMKIFPKDAKLEKEFLAGAAPAAETLLGRDGVPTKWRVTMLTGPVPNMANPPFDHCKVFVRDLSLPEDVGGCNVVFRGRAWGYFKLEKGVYAKEDGGDGLPSIFISYAVARNGRLTRRIRDHVRTTKDANVLIGRFHYLWHGRPRFLGYFTLTRIVDK